MDTQKQQKMRDKVVEEKESNDEGKLKQEATNQQPPTASPSSSPSHEFSFTISLQTINPNKAPKAPQASIAIDLSPADDIFSHGHLLPLHRLSHPPESPRSSTNSLDSFTLPITELYPNYITSTKSDSNIDHHHHYQGNNNINSETTKGIRTKSKSFSFFRLSKRQKGGEFIEREDKDKQKRKVRLEVMSHVVKRYMRMIRPFLSFRGRRENGQLCRQSYSYSGNLSFRSDKQDVVMSGKRREYLSAPASMRTSPANSGLLVATGTTIHTSTSDSTMEELQAAIQAAIAHCKKSIAVEEKNHQL